MMFKDLFDLFDLFDIFDLLVFYKLRLKTLLSLSVIFDVFNSFFLTALNIFSFSVSELQ